MFMQPEFGKISEEDGFIRPVESIMRCENFKSNFARRLSNRYTSKSPVTVRQDSSLKLPSVSTEITQIAPERIEPCSQLSKNVIEQNGEAVKPPDKRTSGSDMRTTEVSALNMEVETLRWQLSQTEANRQMHIALLRQIVSFLSRVKEHIECQKPETDCKKETVSVRLSPRSFNSADLPRSRSVVHVNKSSEYSLSPSKKISTRKISKSISNVNNGCRESNGVWSPTKLPMTTESDSAYKITEEMSRLITLATTVLSTKIPDLASTCSDGNDHISVTTFDINECAKFESASSLNSIDEDTHAFILNTVCDSKDAFAGILDEFTESKDNAIQDFILSPSPLDDALETDITDGKTENHTSIKTPELTKTQRFLEKRNEYNTANFIEDESGFSSMNSFQEIGIPIISIIPPSPCKEVGYMDGITDILDDTANWKNESLDLDKQAVKVFWV